MPSFYLWIFNVDISCTRWLLRLSLLNLDFPPEVTQSTLITESASHHVVTLTETPHNTAHMRQHGKFENFDVWNRDFLTLWAKIWCFSDLHKIYDFKRKYHQKTVLEVSLLILEWFLINSVNVKKIWFFHHFDQFSWGMFLFWHTLSLSNLEF